MPQAGHRVGIDALVDAEALVVRAADALGALPDSESLERIAVELCFDARVAARTAVFDPTCVDRFAEDPAVRVDAVGDANPERILVADAIEQCLAAASEGGAVGILAGLAVGFAVVEWQIDLAGFGGGANLVAAEQYGRWHLTTVDVGAVRLVGEAFEPLGRWLVSRGAAAGGQAAAFVVEHLHEALAGRIAVTGVLTRLDLERDEHIRWGLCIGIDVDVLPIAAGVVGCVEFIAARVAVAVAGIGGIGFEGDITAARRGIVVAATGNGAGGGERDEPCALRGHGARSVESELPSTIPPRGEANGRGVGSKCARQWNITTVAAAATFKLSIAPH